MRTIILSSISKNEMKIDAVVELVAPEGTKNCWRAEACVNGGGMARSHHDDRIAAEAWAKRMQNAYLDVHGGAK